MRLRRNPHAIIVSERAKPRCTHSSNCRPEDNPSHFVDLTVAPWVIETLQAIHRGEVNGGAAIVDLGRVIKALKEAA